MNSVDLFAEQLIIEISILSALNCGEAVTAPQLQHFRRKFAARR